MEILRDFYVGIVEENIDPDRKGRIKVRVQTLYHTIPLEDIPYAYPLGSLSGKEFQVPAIGKLVNVLYFSDDLYSPYYIYSENYNINLQNKLNILSDDEYTEFSALLFDDKTQIYSDNQKLTLDYYFNKMTIDSNSINLELKDNLSRLNLGTKFSTQEAVLGTNFFEWMDKFIDTLKNPMSLVDSSMTAIIRPKLDFVCDEYIAMKKNFLSKNVYIVDNDEVKKIERDIDTISSKNDVDIVLPNDDLSNDLLSRIATQNDASCQELNNSVPTNDIMTTDNPNIDGVTFGSILPLTYKGRVTSKFGLRTIKSLNYKNKMHSGIDIAAPIGTNIFSPWNGIVESDKSSVKGGNTLIIDHKNGFKTGYCHLNKKFVKKGDIVQINQIIGEVGNTGIGTGAHLHFILYISKTSEKINPEKYFDFSTMGNNNNLSSQNYNGQPYNNSLSNCSDSVGGTSDVIFSESMDDAFEDSIKVNGLPTVSRDALNKAMDRHNITNKFSRLALLGIVTKESPSAKSEGTYKNTSVSRIKLIFSESRLNNKTDSELNKIKNNDVEWFNLIYGGSFGRNYGNTQQNDGYNYRGRGFNQITFKSNYIDLQKKYENEGSKLGKINIVKNPDLLLKPDIAAEFCILFFKRGFKSVGIDINIFSSIKDAVNNFVWINSGGSKKNKYPFKNKILIEGRDKSLAFASKELSKERLNKS